jgi:hypothetical protein
VPQAKLECGRVGDDGDGMARQPGRPALRLLLGPAPYTGRHVVLVRGAENRSPTCRCGGVCIACSLHVSGPTLESESGELVRDKVFSCEAVSCRAKWRLVVRGGELSCKGESCCAKQRVVVGGGDLSCEAETCRARRRLLRGSPSPTELVGDASNWSGA